MLSTENFEILLYNLIISPEIHHLGRIVKKQKFKEKIISNLRDAFLQIFNENKKDIMKKLPGIKKILPVLLNREVPQILCDEFIEELWKISSSIHRNRRFYKLLRMLKSKEKSRKKFDKKIIEEIENNGKSLWLIVLLLKLHGIPIKSKNIF